MHIQHRGINSNKPAMTSPTVVSGFFAYVCRHHEGHIIPQCNWSKKSGGLYKKWLLPWIPLCWCDYMVWEDSSSQCFPHPTNPTHPCSSYERCGLQYQMGGEGAFFFVNWELNWMPWVSGMLQLSALLFSLFKWAGQAWKAWIHWHLYITLPFEEFQNWERQKGWS